MGHRTAATALGLGLGLRDRDRVRVRVRVRVGVRVRVRVYVRTIQFAVQTGPHVRTIRRPICELHRFAN